ncbi:MAG: fibronectin type III domain-containing protein, partial [Bacteroidia bacterium]|nr:fibronectin type III domain-containing protein [Bacteroidia bacterium]MDW8158351.1 fibronectin type III domain-containing protein [Bacteroidia bacterium]
NTATWIITFSLFNSAILSNLNSSTTYELVVRSDCGNEVFSNFSPLVQFRTLVLCQEVTALEKQITQTSAYFRWSAVSQAIAYKVRWRPLGEFDWQNTQVTEPRISLENLLPGQTYEIEIQTVCSDNTSAWYHQDFTLLPLCPVVPFTEVVNVGSTEATISFTQVSQARSYYFVYRKVNTSQWNVLLPTTSPVLLSNLEPNTTYEWLIRAECAADLYSSFTEVQQFTTLPACNDVRQLQAEPLVGALSISWQPVLGAEKYGLTYRKVGAFNWSLPIIVESTNYVLEGLEPFTSYEIQIFADCGLHGKSSSQNIQATTSGKCAAPQGIAATQITDTSATLQWNPVLGATRYEVFYRKVNTATWQRSLSLTSTIKLFPLSPSTTYEIMLRTDCNQRFSNFSPVRWFSTLAPQARQYARDESIPIIIYPNPTSRYLHIAELPLPCTLLLTDLQGKLILYKEFSYSDDPSVPLDVSNFTEGWYLIKVFSQDKVHTAKFRKQE